MDQQVYSCCHKFLAVTQSYNSKNTPIGKFHAVKIAKSVFLYVFTMEYPTSPFKEKNILCKDNSRNAKGYRLKIMERYKFVNCPLKVDTISMKSF